MRRVYLIWMIPVSSVPTPLIFWFVVSLSIVQDLFSRVFSDSSVCELIVSNLICGNRDLAFKTAFLQRGFVSDSVRCPREPSPQDHFTFCFGTWGLSHTGRINSGPKLPGMQFFLPHTHYVASRLKDKPHFAERVSRNHPLRILPLQVLHLCISCSPRLCLLSTYSVY